MTATQTILTLDSVRSRLVEILDALDVAGATFAGSDRRRAERWAYRRRLHLRMQPVGDIARRLEVVTRNLSQGGIAFLYTTALDAGTACWVDLVTTDQWWRTACGVIVRSCRVRDDIHEIGVQWVTPLDTTLYVEHDRRIRAEVPWVGPDG